MSEAEIDALLTRFHNKLRMEGPLDVNIRKEELS